MSALPKILLKSVIILPSSPSVYIYERKKSECIHKQILHVTFSLIFIGYKKI